MYHYQRKFFSKLINNQTKFNELFARKNSYNTFLTPNKNTTRRCVDKNTFYFNVSFIFSSNLPYFFYNRNELSPLQKV